MKSLRSAPFLPVACFEHCRILSCCDTTTGAAGAATGAAAGAEGCARVDFGLATASSACAIDAPNPRNAASKIAVIAFIAVSFKCVEQRGLTELSVATSPLTPRQSVGTSDGWTMQRLVHRDGASGQVTAHRSERRIKQGRSRLPGAALSVRLGGQEVTQPYSVTRSGGAQARAAGLVGIRFGHAFGLLVAHRHFALGLFRDDGLGLQAIVDIVLARLAFEFLVG